MLCNRLGLTLGHTRANIGLAREQQRCALPMIRMTSLAIAFASTILLFADRAPVAADETLYDRLGGLDAITAVVEKFTANQLADARISKRYANTDIAAWRGHLTDLICAAAGGPCEYTGLAMENAHARQDITDDEFAWTAEHLVAALEHFDVPQAEQDELVAVVASLKDKVVGQ
jgi:hemoglobin